MNRHNDRRVCADAPLCPDCTPSADPALPAPADDACDAERACDDFYVCARHTITDAKIRAAEERRDATPIRCAGGCEQLVPLGSVTMHHGEPYCEECRTWVEDGVLGGEE